MERTKRRHETHTPRLPLVIAAACLAVTLAADSAGGQDGTPSGNCHPSYEGRCLPADVSDVDCAGGNGDGPAFVSGPVRVVGPDVYRLDRDGDGIACEPTRR